MFSPGFTGIWSVMMDGEGKDRSSDDSGFTGILSMLSVAGLYILRISSRLLPAMLPLQFSICIEIR